MRALLFVLALALVACTPRIPEGLACTTSADCPPGQTCTSAGLCRIAGSDAGPTPDTGIDAGHDASVDAAGLDAGIDASDDDAGMRPTITFGSETTTGPLASGLGMLVSFVTGEVGSDGIDDFVIGGASHAYVYRSTGPLIYESAVDYASMGLGLDWTLSDAEPDGTLDLWSLSDPSDGRVVTLPNTGTDFDTSSGTVVYGQGASLRSIVLSDITGDGVPDLVVSGTLGVHATDRGGGGDLGVIVTGPAYETLVVHGDSEPHLFVIANDVRYFLHSGFGSTTEVTTFPPAGSDLSSPLDAVLCDLEGDGDDDVVLLRASGSGDEIVVLRQTETGDLEIAARFDVAANANAVAAADLDGFGAPEIVVSRASTASIDVASIYDATTGAELVQLPTGDRVDVVTGNYDHEEPVDVAFVAADGSVDIWINQTR